VTGDIPTRRGDVLILSNAQAGGIHFLAIVSQDGEYDVPDSRFCLMCPGSRLALDEARRLVAPGCRIYFRDLDTGYWCQIPPDWSPANRVWVAHPEADS
jgi:hypothetical protein